MKTRQRPKAASRKTSRSKRKARAYDIVVLAASAGGQAAITAVLSQLDRDFPLPIVLMQHLGEKS
ncbi:MAG TPA: chemotaxis protein CheB, partial [Burkholderiales bacterium]|nr:chemotaxis protein CheB [Burkholderiales bacterium]